MLDYETSIISKLTCDQYINVMLLTLVQVVLLKKKQKKGKFSEEIYLLAEKFSKMITQTQSN